MLYGYARVSTVNQSKNGTSMEDQANKLKEEGCKIIFQEQFTGASTHRPKLEELINLLQAGDTLMVTKLDRLARNVLEGIEMIRQLFAKGVRVHVLNVGLLENTSMGNFFLTTLLAVAELERSMIFERTQAGKEMARQQPGYREGRPRLFTDYQISNALNLLNEHSFTQVARLTGISRATLLRASAAAKTKESLKG